MSYFSGSRGAMYMDDINLKNVYIDPLAKVTGWELVNTAETIDVTTLMDTDRVFIPGLKSYNGSAEILYFKAPGTGGPKYSALLDRIFAPRKPDSTPGDNTYDNTGVSATPPTVGFKLMITDYNPAYTGTDPGPDDDRPEKKELFIMIRAIVTSASISQRTADVCRGSIQFQVIGAPLQYQL